MKRATLALATAIAAALIIIAAVVFYFVSPSRRAIQTASQPPPIGKAAVGKAAPQFEVATTRGLFNLATVRKPVFLEVFATWCPHCQREAPVVDRLYNSYRGRVVFLGVSGSNTAMDGSSPSSELDVFNWIRDFHVAYPIAYDPLLNVANLYLQSGFPTFAIIGTDKKVKYLADGEIAYPDLSKALEKALSS